MHDKMRAVRVPCIQTLFEQVREFQECIQDTWNTV